LAVDYLIVWSYNTYIDANNLEKIMKTSIHNLPNTLVINAKVLKLNWVEISNLDGFVAEIEGVPINDFASSEEAEISIYNMLGLKSDVYADGSATIYYSI
jgi:hypothetical protein